MEEFLRSCCTRYEELAGGKVTWKHADTPFLDEGADADPSRDPVASDAGIRCPFCDGVYPEDSFDKVKNGEANHRKGKKKLCEHMASEAPQEQGRLATIAAKVIMKVFYAARVARYDLLRAIGGLARHITKWTPECDRRLERLMNYVHSTLEYRQVGWVGDDIGKVNMDLYADANYGKDDGKSTTGVQLHVDGTTHMLSHFRAQCESE